MNITLASDIQRAIAKIGEMGNQSRFVTALALTKVGQAVKAEIKTEMPKAFDRPTPYTLNAVQLIPAKKDNLSAVVWLKDAPRYGETHYLFPQVEGGQRGRKRSETWIGSMWAPGRGARKDQYGNMSRGQIVEIMSYLQAHPDLHANVSAASQARNKKWQGPRAVSYFIAMRNGQPVGMMQRIGKNRTLPVMSFIKAASYRPRLPMLAIGDIVVARDAEKEVMAAWLHAITSGRGW